MVETGSILGHKRRLIHTRVRKPLPRGAGTPDCFDRGGGLRAHGNRLRSCRVKKLLNPKAFLREVSVMAHSQQNTIEYASARRTCFC